MIEDRIEDVRRMWSGTYVRLRPIQTTDAKVTLDWRLGERAALLNDGAQTLAAQVAWIEARPATEVNFIIETFVDPRAVGMISLVGIDLAARRAEAARFLIGEERSARGLPVAAEAMLLLYDLAFDGLGLHEIYGTVAEDNTAVLKWHRYLGMQEAGILPQKACINGRVQCLIGIKTTHEYYRMVIRPRLGRLVSLGRASITNGNRANTDGD